ncbi:outer membrane beta-barrel protein [soil metagenome]
MNRVSPLYILIVCFAGISLPAAAQAPPIAIPANDFGPVWTGFYAGAAFGAGGLVNKLNSSGGGVSTAFNGAGQSGVLGSIYGGVDYQITQRGIVGLLGELSYGGFQGTVNATTAAGTAASVSQNSGFGWSVLARAGFLASPSTLLYLAGGYTGQMIHSSAFASGPGGTANASTNSTVNGWTVGPGFESMLTSNLSAKLEYRYSQFGSQTIAGTGIAMQPSSHALRVGLSYRFGGLGVVSSGESFGSGYQPPFNWTGVYGGVAAGGGMGFGRVNAVAGGNSAAFDSGGQGLLGGFFGGADWQFSPRAVAGVLGDFTWQGLQSSATITTPFGGAYASAQANRQWSVMGRLGWLPVPSTLLYAAGGYSQLNVQSTVSGNAFGAAAFGQSNTTFNGFTVGPGIETAVTGGWTTRLEYRFSQFEQQQLAPGVSLQPSNHTIRAGLSYKFGIGPTIGAGTSTAQAGE